MSVVGILHAYVTNLCRGRHVLYVGAGDDLGNVAPSAIETASVSASWHGIDIDPSLPTKAHGLSISTIDLNTPFTLRLPGVDLVVMTEVIEHVHSPIFTLNQLSRSLPGVEFVGSVPNALSYGRILIALFSNSIYRRQDEKHLSLHNPTTIRNTLSGAQLQNVSLVPYQERTGLRLLTGIFPSFASGFIIHARLPGGTKGD